MIKFDDGGTIAAARQPFSSMRVERVCAPVISRAGGEMKRYAYEKALKTPHLTERGTNAPLYARSIMFKKDGPLAVDVFARKGVKGQQGGLSRILEFGWGPTAPHQHFRPALYGEVEPTARWLGEVLVKEFRK